MGATPETASVSASSSIADEMEASVHRGGDVPDWLCCPLTGHLFRDPVILPSGYSFDREALLVRWRTGASGRARAKGKDPITVEDIESGDIVPHFALRDACEEWRLRVKTRDFEEEEAELRSAMVEADAAASSKSRDDEFGDWELI